MKHKCINWIENGCCTKCRTPEWALYFPEFKHKVGNKVIIPKGYTDAGKLFFILKKKKDNSYVIGITKENPIESYEWWELYPVS